MSSWDDMLAADAVATSGAAGGGELITWTPGNGNEPRSFYAQVIRDGDVPTAPGQSRALRQRAVLHLPVHPTAGIDALGDGDTFAVAMTPGATPSTCEVTRVLAEHAGFVIVEVAP